MTTSTRRSTRALLTIAVAAPLALGLAFVPIFRLVQSWNRPTGSVQDIDMTSFARRDELMFSSFEVALVATVIVAGFLATSWRSRLIVIAAGAAAAFLSYLAVFASLFAG